MKGEGGVGLGRWVLFWTIALGGTAFDLLTKAIIFERVGPPPAPSVTIVPHILERHTSQNTGVSGDLARACRIVARYSPGFP